MTTAKQRLTTKTATLRTCSRVPQVFSSRCTHCWVSCCASFSSCASCRLWCSCRCDRPLNLYPKFFREALTNMHRVHRESGEERPEPIHLYQYQRWQSSSSSSSTSWWQWNQDWWTHILKIVCYF